MPLIIDGHNLIGQMRGLSLSDPDDESQLLARLSAYQRRRRDEMIVVFDSGLQAGLPGSPQRHESGLRVVYARTGQRADDVIVRLVHARGGRDCRVVSSDRAVQAEVRALGAQVIPAPEFAQRLRPEATRPQAPSEKERPPSASEVEAWLEIFARAKPKRR